MSDNDSERINGFRRDDLNLLKRGLHAHQDNAQFKLRARNRWIDGAQSLSLVSSFHGMGREFSARPTPFIQTTDMPAVLLGKDGGPSPMEELLVALAASMTTTVAYRAAFTGLPLQEIESEVEGEFDLQTVVGAAAQSRPGLREIHVTVHVKSDATEEQIAALCAANPALEAFAQPVPVFLTVKTH